MKRNEKKEILTLPFSYIDIFFVLLAGLVLSLGIYYVAEEKQKNKADFYRVELSSFVEEDMARAIPEAGESIFKNEKAIGEILSVEREEKSRGYAVSVVCLISEKDIQVGKDMTLETPGCICTMQIDSAQRVDSFGEGRYFD